MATVSYGTITITDLTDITDVYLEYCMVEAGKTASQVEAKSIWISPEVSWSTTYPTWQSGYEIWVRQVQIKEGIESGIYTIQFSATTSNSVIFRLHGYDSNGQWLRQLFTTTITSTSTLPIIQTLELPSDIKFVRLSYPLTGVENTGIFKGESTSNGTGLIDVSTNESGSIPVSGTPATNSSFNRTQLIAVYPQGYGTPYLDTAVNQINNNINNITDSLTILEAKAKYFINNATGSLVIASKEKTIPIIPFDEDDISTYGFNSLTAPNYISLRYDDINLSKWATDKLTFYIPTYEFHTYTNIEGNPKELQLLEYNENTSQYFYTEDEQFNQEKIYYYREWIQGEKGLEITADGIDLYNPSGNKGLEITSNGIDIFGENETKGLSMQSGGLVIYDPSETSSALIAVQQTGFRLGYDADTLEGLDPYTTAIAEPFIVWQKAEDNEQDAHNRLYVYTDDIILRINDNSPSTQQLFLKDKLSQIDDNILANNQAINTNKQKIQKNENEISVNTQNIILNKENISKNTTDITLINNKLIKIKAYWTIDNNNHLTLVEGVLNG